MLSEAATRATWEVERDSIRAYLLSEKKFNPRSVERFIDTFIESMAFAQLPCCSEAGIAAGWEQFKKQATQ